jgi:hypothetical protein
MSKKYKAMTKFDAEISGIESRVERFKKIGFVLILISIICALYPLIWFDIKHIRFNEYGDFVGGPVASILSIAAMMFIYVAYLGQRHQILIQKNEIKEGKNQYDIQQFENRFFLLLQLHIDNLNAMDYRKKDGQIISEGRDCFRSYYKLLDKEVIEIKKIEYIKINNLANNEVIDRKDSDRIILTLDTVGDAFVSVYSEMQSDLDHYYGSLGHLMRYIDESDLPINKTDYFEIIRTQLSTYELIFIYYYTNLGGNFLETDLSKLTKAYNLLKQIDSHNLFESS